MYPIPVSSFGPVQHCSQWLLYLNGVQAQKHSQWTVLVALLAIAAYKVRYLYHVCLNWTTATPHVPEKKTVDKNRCQFVA